MGRIGYWPAPASLPMFPTMPDIQIRNCFPEKYPTSAVLVFPACCRRMTQSVYGSTCWFDCAASTTARKVRVYDWDEIASRCQIEKDVLATVRKAIEPGLDAIARALKDAPQLSPPRPAKLPHPTRSASGHVLDDIGPAERRRLVRHLPDDSTLDHAESRKISSMGPTRHHQRFDRLQALPGSHEATLRYLPSQSHL